MRPPDNAVARPASGSKRPRAASASATGRAEASAGTYSGVRTKPSSVSRVSVRRWTSPVTGCATPISRGSVASSARQSARSAG